MRSLSIKKQPLLIVPVFTNCVSPRDFDTVLNSLKHVVVREEVQCFDFPLQRDIKHKSMDARFLTNVDEEEGQEKSTSVYSENLDVFEDVGVTPYPQVYSSSLD
jgi:hypothetical protein